MASLKVLQRNMELQERIDIIIEIEILRALCYQKQDNRKKALASLQAALSLAKPGGYVRIFVDEGEAMRRLLILAAARGIEAAYSGQLLAAYTAEKIEGADPTSPDQSGMAEPLSARELQVLKLLASSLTSTEIGQELFITANTARFHIKNIYSKLDVHRRSEAVARARALELI
jgi:LuxR family maltose regulon positive regulatory protein